MEKPPKNHLMDRRTFLQIAGALGLGIVFEIDPTEKVEAASVEYEKVPSLELERSDYQIVENPVVDLVDIADNTDITTDINNLLYEWHNEERDYDIKIHTDTDTVETNLAEYLGVDKIQQVNIE
ncbi:hypothetical protein GF389_05885, partial [Candidatus Dojkabacteria bacterium]|nr:hypothetical protein [Candidatus Dojkabacteria bacterium]